MVLKLEKEVERIAEEIRFYLLNHPDAADTLEGVTKWWLTRQRYEEAAALVKLALENLIARGLIAKTTSADEQCIYRKREMKNMSARTQ